MTDPIAVFNFAKNRFWWNGQKRSLSDLTSYGNGSYSLPWASVAGSFTGGFSIQVEASISATGNSGRLFGWHNRNTDSLRVEVGGNGTLSLVKTQPTTSPTVGARVVDINGAGLEFMTGFNRSIWSLPLSGVVSSISNLGNYLTSSGAVETANTPGTSVDATGNANIHFYRHATTGVVATGSRLLSVTIWGVPLAEAEMKRRARSNHFPPIHLVGDSFLTAGLLRNQLRGIAASRGVNIDISQDGVGSTTLTQQAVRHGNWPEFYDRTLVIMDGALEVTGAQALTEISTMTGRLSHSRWVYVQSNPINPIGDSRRTDWIAKDAEILASVGASKYVPTLAAMLAAGDGSSADNARIAQGLYPTSKCADVVHPFEDGYRTHALQIAAKLRENGWFP